MLCVDDNPDLLASIRMIINAQPNMRCVGCLASASGLLIRSRRLMAAPGAALLVILLDAIMPGRNPLEVLRELAAELPGVRTIMFSGNHNPAFIHEAMDAGAWGCISKTASPVAIVQAVSEVAGRPVRMG